MRRSGSRRNTCRLSMCTNSNSHLIALRKRDRQNRTRTVQALVYTKEVRFVLTHVLLAWYALGLRGEYSQS